MATINAQSIFGVAAVSDVVFQCGERSVPCSRAILTAASRPLGKLVASDSGFREAKQEVIELDDDDPEAVLAMLKHAYSFPYGDIVGKNEARRKPEFHLSVYTVAHKFEISGLQRDALRALDDSLEKIDLDRPSSRAKHDVEYVFDLVKFLAQHKDFDTAFVNRSNAMIEKNMSGLVRLKEFLLWIVEDGNPAIDCLGRAVDRRAKRRIHKITSCRECDQVWTETGTLEHRCTRQATRVDAVSCATISLSVAGSEVYWMQQTAPSKKQQHAVAPR
ncbi:uncharacterized protein LTR77_002123 [Saxophila tyrrhenica]|uniref:BTB domain-containing protein n=1 Tax=Saxophila tyrrhenica TaxID=1690608 RepID=A0AAV9PKF9_9PEZI|nr:hypothetical protein LTR77_002123 [Saxophila tyrrhenica]